jgi:Zn-dependent peptidase ImmA (M78 family)/transcriptional regulator with XRE-family HTH domain
MAPTHESIVEHVREAIRALSITQTDLASRVGMDATALSKSLNGGRHFKPVELASIAEVLGVSVAWLLSVGDDLPQPTLVAARVQPAADPSMVQAQTRIDDFVEINNLLIDQGYRPRPPKLDGLLDEVAEKSPAEQGYAMADLLRERLGIGHDDLPSQLDGLAEYVEENLGIDVAFEPLDPGLDGMSLVRGDFKLALIGSGVSATRQRFTTGHEVCHVLAGDSQSLKIDRNVTGTTADDEVRANAFSAAFLMPRQAMVEATEGRVIDEGLIADLLGRFRVSLDALAIRLRHCDLIDPKETDRIRSMSSARIAMRRGRTQDLQARNDRRQPGLLLTRALNAYVEGVISIRPVARLLQMDANLLLDELTPPRLLASEEHPELPAL